MVDIYPVLVKLVVLSLSSKLKVSHCTFSKPYANITSFVVYDERRHGTARDGVKETACKVSLTETMIVAKHNMTIEPWMQAAKTVILKFIILTAVRNSVTG